MQPREPHASSCANTAKRWWHRESEMYCDHCWKRETTPTPKTTSTIKSLLKDPRPPDCRASRVCSTTWVSFVRPSWVLGEDEIGLPIEHLFFFGQLGWCLGGVLSFRGRKKVKKHHRGNPPYFMVWYLYGVYPFGRGVYTLFHYLSQGDGIQYSFSCSVTWGSGDRPQRGWGATVVVHTLLSLAFVKNDGPRLVKNKKQSNGFLPFVTTCKHGSERSQAQDAAPCGEAVSAGWYTCFCSTCSRCRTCVGSVITNVWPSGASDNSCLSLYKINQHKLLKVGKTQGCWNGRFGKRCFCPLPKTGGLRKIGDNSDIAFYPQKQGFLLLGPRKSTKMTKMAGVTQAKWPFAKSTVWQPRKKKNT